MVTQSYGDYEVESFLGKGSIGKVYLARHRRIGRRVALKTVHLEQKFEDDADQTEFYKRLQREAELCASMQHPNVVTLYDVGYDGEVVSWLATEYVDGESLLARLRRTRPLPLEEALNVSADLLRGLAYAHSKGIIHRDIKPANILLTSAGQAKIADFGVARPLHSSLTATRSLVGTPNYMSPEQVKTTPVSTRSDLFSAGVVMYEMLTGIKPFGAPELSGILYNVVNLSPPLATEVNSTVPVPVALIVSRMLEKKPESRYATADEALAELEETRAPSPSSPAGTETIAVTTQTDTPHPAPFERTELSLLRRPVPPLVFWITTFALLSALAMSVVTMRQRIDAEQPEALLTRAQIEEAQAKRRQLAQIRGLVDNGHYEEAIAAYGAYLERYPQSTVARIERDEAEELMRQNKAETEVTKVGRKPRRTRQATPPEPKPSRWDRFKKWFRGG